MFNIQYSLQRYSFFLICANLFVVVQLIYRIVPLFASFPFHPSPFRFPFSVFRFHFSPFHFSPPNSECVPIHNRYITDTYEYPVNTPRILREYPMNTPIFRSLWEKRSIKVTSIYLKVMTCAIVAYARAPVS